MGIHHVALATRDVEATHAFYTGPMGFRLVKVEPAKAGEDGFAKHLFYDTGGHGMIAFWDIHDPALPAGWSPAIADGLGLPRWTNHIAFTAHSAAELEKHLARWQEGRVANAARYDEDHIAGLTTIWQSFGDVRSMDDCIADLLVP